jgi:multiple sugar transport system permease protein
MENLTAIKSKRRGHSRIRRAENIQGFLLAVIPVVRFVIFGFVPMAVALVMAFLKMDTFLLSDGVFCGLENFRNVLSDKMFWGSILNTFYLAVSLPASLLIALLLAILLAGNIALKKFFRTALFIPFVCSVVAVTLMWRWLLDYNYGIVNQLFNIDINWRGDPDWYIPGLIMMTVWSSTAYKIILLSAALTQVNENYYEAAELDGAGSFRKLWHITLPAISPTVFFLVVIGLINILQEFSRSQVWDPAGGPNGKGLTIVFYLYRHAFQYIDMGAASAVAWLLSVIILILTFINFKIKDRWVYD